MIERIVVGKEQLEKWPEKIEVRLLLSRDIYKVLFEIAVNQEPQISVVEVIHMCLESDTQGLRDMEKNKHAY